MGLLLPGSVSKPSFLCSYSNEDEGRGPPVTVLTQSYPGATLQTNLLTRLQDKTESRSELQETTGNWKGTTQTAMQVPQKCLHSFNVHADYTIYIKKESNFFFSWVTFNIFRNQINTSYEQETGSRLGINCSFWFQGMVLPDLINNIKKIVILNTLHDMLWQILLYPSKKLVISAFYTILLWATGFSSAGLPGMNLCYTSHTTLIQEKPESTSGSNVLVYSPTQLRGRSTIVFSCLSRRQQNTAGLVVPSTEENCWPTLSSCRHQTTSARVQRH